MPLELGGGVEGRGTAGAAGLEESPLARAADDDSSGSLAATLAASDRGPLVRNGLLDLGPFSSARGGEEGRRRGGSSPAAACAADAPPPVRC